MAFFHKNPYVVAENVFARADLSVTAEGRKTDHNVIAIKQELSL